MSLITQEDLATLHAASAVKTIADGAAFDAEIMALAKLINSSANTGQYEVLYNHEISEDARTELETNGYTVQKRSKLVSSSPEVQNIISWK